MGAIDTRIDRLSVARLYSGGSRAVRPTTDGGRGTGSTGPVFRWAAYLTLLSGAWLGLLLSGSGPASVHAQAAPTPTPIPVMAVQDASLDEAMRLVEGATTGQMVDLFLALSVTRAAEISAEMDADTAAHVLEGIGLDRASEIMGAADSESESRILDELLSEDALAARLPRCPPKGFGRCRSSC